MAKTVKNIIFNDIRRSVFAGCAEMARDCMGY
jgi:hypothetical protein